MATACFVAAASMSSPPGWQPHLRECGTCSSAPSWATWHRWRRATRPAQPEMHPVAGRAQHENGSWIERDSPTPMTIIRYGKGPAGSSVGGPSSFVDDFLFRLDRSRTVPGSRRASAAPRCTGLRSPSTPVPPGWTGTL